MARVDQQVDKSGRNERGKLAQRAYRKRHASKFQKLQEDNAKLRDIIDRLDTALHRRGQLPVEVEALFAEARQISSNDDAIYSGSGDKASSSSASPPLQREGIGLVEPSHRTVNEIEETATAPAGDGQVVAVAAEPSAQAGGLLPVTAAVPEVVVPDPIWEEGGGSPSPLRIISNDCLGRIFRCDPSYLVQYFGEAMFSLVGCVFWSSIIHAVTVYELNQETASHVGGISGETATGRATTAIATQAQSPAASLHEIPSDLVDRSLRRIFNRARILGDEKFIQSLRRCREHYDSHGFILSQRASSPLLNWSSAPAWEPWPPQAIPEIEIDDTTDEAARAPGARPGALWRSPEQVLAHLESQIGRKSMRRLDVIARRAGAVLEARQDGGAPSPHDLLPVERLSQLLLWLAQNYACHKDGPRWNAVYVSIYVGGWVDVNRGWLEDAREET